ncbi:MAG: hypothetical protein ACKVQW_06675 [Pyrinomonadaceae bacterium]
MNKTSRTIITLAVVLAGSMLASALMLKFTPNDSWLAFAGWMILFVAIQSPFLFIQSAQDGCTAWLARFRKGE